MTAQPLAGRRVVVTQAAHQAPELAALLAAAGAVPLLYPCIAIQPPPDATALDAALAELAAGGYDWLALTSANTARALAERAEALGLPLSIFARARVAAIGAATAEAATALLARTPDLIPAESVAEGLAESLLHAAPAAAPAGAPAGARLLLPQADIARPVLQRTLAAAGFAVTPVTAYCTTVGSGGVHLPDLLARGEVDAITFTSSSTVRNLLRRLEQEGGDPARLAGVTLAAIGPITAQTIAECGLPPALVAAEQSLEALVAALVNYF